MYYPFHYSTRDSPWDFYTPANIKSPMCGIINILPLHLKYSNFLHVCVLYYNFSQKLGKTDLKVVSYIFLIQLVAYFVIPMCSHSAANVLTLLWTRIRICFLNIKQNFAKSSSLPLFAQLSIIL